jgi:hypothetical protein
MHAQSGSGPARRKGPATAALIAAALALSLSAGSADAAGPPPAAVPPPPSIKLVQVSADPYTNATAEHATEVEPVTVAAGRSVLSVFQVGRRRTGCSDNIGWALSTDAGRSWRHGFLPGLTRFSRPAGPFAAASNAVVAYSAAAKQWIVEALDCGSTKANAQPSVSVSVSRDGAHWSKPVIAARISTPGELFDKPWITCDNTPSSPFYGNCYIEWNIVSQSALVVMSTSRDGGRTWSAPAATQGHLHGESGEPVVQPDGTVVVPLLGIFGSHVRWVDFRSTDGGKTWGRTVTISRIPQYSGGGNLRLDFQATGVDHAGRIYLTWNDCRFRAHCSANDMVLTTSADGLHWTPVRRIPIAPVTSTVDAEGGGLGVDQASAGRHARLGLFYYYFSRARCTDASCRLFAGYVSSTDGGAHWSAPRVVAGPMRLNQLARAFSLRMVGDEMTAAVVPGGRAFAALALGRNPSARKPLNEAMYEPRNGLPITGGSHTG